MRAFSLTLRACNYSGTYSAWKHEQRNDGAVERVSLYGNRAANTSMVERGIFTNYPARERTFARVRRHLFRVSHNRAFVGPFVVETGLYVTEFLVELSRLKNNFLGAASKLVSLFSEIYLSFVILFLYISIRIIHSLKMSIT